jgi:hypothetical protein
MHDREVHMSDLIRAHEGNADFHAEHPEKIHWGKFNMMGRFISSTVQCQKQCKNTSDYRFNEQSPPSSVRLQIREIILTNSIMDDDV